jgi:hypothetical protein
MKLLTLLLTRRGPIASKLESLALSAALQMLVMRDSLALLQLPADSERPRASTHAAAPAHARVGSKGLQGGWRDKGHGPRLPYAMKASFLLPFSPQVSVLNTR